MQFEGQYFTNGKPNLELITEKTNENLTRSMIESNRLVGERIAQDLETETSRDNVRAALEVAYESGISRDEIIEIVESLKCNVSYTWHPTNNLSEEGTKLRLKQIEAFQNQDTRAIRELTKEIKGSDNLTPKQKATMINEIDANLTIADRDNKGANTVERIYEEEIQDIWSGKRPNIQMNLGGRSWIFDADGKNNNDGWAMMAALTTLKKEMFEQTLEVLDDDLVTGNPKLEKLRNDLGMVLNNLNSIYDKSREVTDTLAQLPVEERETYYRAHYDELQTAKDNLRSLYECVGDAEGRGHNFYNKTKQMLEEACEKQDCASGNNPKLDDVYRTLRRNGFTLQKGQTRHNGIMYGDVIDKLFADETFLNSKFLRDSDRNLLQNVEKFSDLHQNQRRMIMAHVTRGTKDRSVRQELQKFVRDANPLEFDEGNGYPTPESSVEDRMDIRSICKRNFAEAIISDSTDFSAYDQLFLAKIEGVPDMKHMMLNEDRDTLARQASIAVGFNKGAQEGAEFRNNGSAADYKIGPDNEILIMIPSSDSMRNGGPGTLLQMCNTVSEATRESIKLGVPIEIMLGSGGSMGRFGCDQAMVRRLVAQTMQQVAEEEGFYEWDKNDPEHAAALRMPKVIMHTEQGRMPNLLSATPELISQRHLDRTGEMLEDHLELVGAVEPGTYIDQVPKLSTPMQNKVPQLQQLMITEFTDFRFALGEQNADDNILNSMAEKCMFKHLSPFINHGARPAAKGSKKGITDVRAIENDKRKAMAEIFDSSFFSLGAAMKELHRSTNSNEPMDRPISNVGVQELIEQPEWNFLIFGKGTTEAMRFEATKKFETLSGEAESWNFDKAVEVGKSVTLEKIEPNEPKSLCVMHYDDKDGAITKEEAYLSKIYYDRLQFLALTEASLKGELNRDFDEIINEFRPSDGSLEFEPGAETLEKWSVAQEVYDNHRENDEMLEMVQEIETYFRHRIETEGASKEEVVAEFGGEEKLREICSSYMEGTLAHIPFWTGDYNYGKDHRLATRQAMNDNNVDHKSEIGLDID